MALALAVAAAILAACALRLPSLVATALAAYIGLVAQLGFATWTLSPFRDVTSVGLAAEEAVLVAGAATAWWLRGRLRRPRGSASLRLPHRWPAQWSRYAH